ncbi:MAG: hypothetical protein WC217_00585 [Candidatus Paceibacterota bacterium]
MSPLREIIAPFVLASFLMVTFFGFASMVHGSDGQMQTDCPFTQTGASLCPQDAVTMVMHHIATYQSFLTMSVGPSLMALIIAAFSIVSLAAILFARPRLQTFAASRGALYKSPPPISYNRKLTRWLSILENSPSFN